jgi:anaphase-promoting complex subunit 8
MMPKYALYYYRKASTLRPYDPRMWCALGQCYESLRYYEVFGWGGGGFIAQDAIKCYLRAVDNNDRENVALKKLALLYHELSDQHTAAHYQEKIRAQAEERVRVEWEGEG